jgi:hypothetical protein
VAQQDNEQFSDYLRKKTARDEQEKTQAAPAPQAIPVSQPGPKKLNRRSLLTWAAGTAVVGEAVTLGYPMLSGQNIPDHGARHAGATYTEPQRHPIDRELVNPQADVGGRRFGDWVLLMPTKMGGGTYAVNLNTGSSPGSRTGTTATTTRFHIICARSQARIRPRVSNGSIAPKAARTR